MAKIESDLTKGTVWKQMLLFAIPFFISNLILLLSLVFSGFESKIGFLSKLPDVSVYIFTFLVFLALNDEKSAHRKTKDIKSQKSIIALKGFLIFIFVMYFFKNPIGYVVYCAIAAIYIIYLHRENIKRLIKKEENY